MRVGASRHLVVAAAAAVMLGAGVITVTTVAAETAGQTVDWQPCPEAEKIDCGNVTVPLDWDDPSGEAIDIQLFRWAATDPGKRIGSLLTLGVPPDYPPGSGIGAVTAAVNERFDVVSFAPRDAGIRCDSALVEEAMAVRNPQDSTQFDEMIAANSALSRNCRELTGPLYDNVDNLNDVQDMDVIRQALGEAQLTYVSGSEGTLRGQQYVEEFPDNTRAMVLDANLDHSLEETADLMSDQVASAEANFAAFIDWCGANAGCALNGTDIRAGYDELKERAKSGELVDPETGEPMDFFALSDTTFTSYDPQEWPGLADTLKAMLDGGFDPTTTNLDESSTSTEPVNHYYQAQWCQNWDFPVADFDEWQQLHSRVAEQHPTVEWSPVVAGFVSMCVGYDGEVTNPQAPLEIEGGPPLVVVGTDHDHTTPPAWSRTVAEQTDAALVTYEGFGHMIYGGHSDCVNEAIDAYLIDLTVPADGLSCPSLDVPGETGDGG